MLVIKEVAELRAALREKRRRGLSIGFVPTMGALHQGHLSLVRSSREECDVTIVSIFVNPLQFNSQEDLKKYPRNLDEDGALLEKEGIDIIFAPEEDEMYPDKSFIQFKVGEFANQLEGAFRPGHFEGVCMVVAKLFNLVNPDKAYFGLKDLQQFMLIKSMIGQLSYGIELVGVETERNKQGLALSSRNQRLSSEGIELASSLFEGLTQGELEIRDRKPLEEVKNNLTNFFDTKTGIELEYCEIIDPETFLPLQSLSKVKNVAICLAAYIEGIRLIDNVYLRFD